MRQSIETASKPIKAESARDLQATLYREIGISAVAAALRFTTQPEPGQRQPEAGQTAQPEERRAGLAA
jgi:hypothetical protein